MNAVVPAMLLLGFSAAVIVVASEGDQPRFKITTKKKDDTVEVRADKTKTMFVVKSPFGISQAVIERQAEAWQRGVVLRLHLKGLERFRVSNGKVTLDAAASVQESKPKVRLWKDDKEDTPLDEKSPFWTDIRIVGGDGKPARELPLKDGYFEVTLPKAFFDGNPESITVNWIDFYRKYNTAFVTGRFCFVPHRKALPFLPKLLQRRLGITSHLDVQRAEADADRVPSTRERTISRNLNS